MTTSTHPDDIDLFDYVEGDLDQEQHADVAAHIAACPSCADHVRLLERGKGALRESALLHLPPKRRSALLGGLPDQPRERRAPGSRRSGSWQSSCRWRRCWWSRSS